jgi:hypothetical protein
VNRTDFQQLADTRIAEANALLTLANPMPSGAYYLAGYAVECALKACIAKNVNQYDFPDKLLATKSYTHNIEELVSVAGLKPERDAVATAAPLLDQNWNIVKDWSEGARYEQHSQSKAEKLYNAIADSVNGVLPWIKARW